MNILVCIKQTFDTEEKIAVLDGQVAADGAEYIVNPYDEYALEEAIRLKENKGGEITVVSVGPDRTEAALRTALAMGADKAVLVSDDVLISDELVTAKVLSAVARRNSYDLILSGCMSIDNGSSQVGPRIAEELDIPHVSVVTGLEIADGKAVVERDAEGDLEIVECSLPALFTAQQGLNEPRYPSLPGIMKAKSKPLERLTLADLALDPQRLAAMTEVIETYLPPQKQPGKRLKGEVTDQVKELVRLLRSDEKVI